MIKLNRQRVCLKKMAQPDNDYVRMTAPDRISFVWELTAELWSLKDKDCVKRRLQRDITTLIKK